MRVGIVVFPGSNRDRDVESAITRVSGTAPRRVWHAETALPDLDLIVLPGGFSHGDYLRCGAMAARAPVMRAVREHAERGGYVLGICNGFQILTEAGMLPGAMLRNAGLRFLAQDCLLRVERTDTRFTAGYAPRQVLRIPMAHGDGNYVANDATLERIEGEGRVAFRYVDASGAATDTANLNGSARGIAGVLSPGLRVLGVMPHPENHTDPLVGGTDGVPLFASLLAA